MRKRAEVLSVPVPEWHRRIWSEYRAKCHTEACSKSAAECEAAASVWLAEFRVRSRREDSNGREFFGVVRFGA